METIIEKNNQDYAKGIVDTLFDSKVFRESITRDNLSTVEEVIAIHLQHNQDTFKKVYPLLQKLKK